MTLSTPAATTLGQLAKAILDTVDFDHDHLDEFYIASSAYGKRSALVSKTRAELADEQVTDITLSEILPLPKKKKLYYLFDPGDGWRFEITASGKTATAMADKSSTHILEQSGVRPLQYGGNTDEDDA
jgi:hypothetical protein